LEKHFLQEEDLQIVLTSMGTTKSVCWKLNSLLAGIVT
jgi:hypothetical protein